MLFEVSLEVVHDFTTSYSAGSLESQQNDDIYFACFPLFFTIIASIQHPREGLRYLRTGGHPRSSGSNRLRWALKAIIPCLPLTEESRLAEWPFAQRCLPPAHIQSLYDPCNCLHIVCVCVCNHETNTQDVYTHGDMFVCVCCGFGRNVSDPAPFTTVRQQHVFSERRFSQILSQ